MATATKFVPSKTPGEAAIPAIDIDAHQLEMKRRQAEHDAKREELLRCLNPAFAAQREAEKPVYKWTVSGKWIGPHDDGVVNFEAEETVVAQNENDAWAAFCDAIGSYPSRRDCKPSIKRGKQLSASAVAAMVVSSAELDAAIPTVQLAPKKKSRRL